MKTKNAFNVLKKGIKPIQTFICDIFIEIIKLCMDIVYYFRNH